MLILIGRDWPAPYCAVCACSPRCTRAVDQPPAMKLQLELSHRRPPTETCVLATGANLIMQQPTPYS